jgi:hypothetical protein
MSEDPALVIRTRSSRSVAGLRDEGLRVIESPRSTPQQARRKEKARAGFMEGLHGKV